MTSQTQIELLVEIKRITEVILEAFKEVGLCAVIMCVVIFSLPEKLELKKTWDERGQE
jgi:hypothetical protein